MRSSRVNFAVEEATSVYCNTNVRFAILNRFSCVGLFLEIRKMANVITSANSWIFSYLKYTYK